MNKNKRRNGTTSLVGVLKPLVEGVWAKDEVRHVGVAKSLDFVGTNFCRPIHVRDLANASGLSHRGFHKAFQKQTGLSPGKALRRLRIEYGKRVMVKEKLTVSQVASRCGFRSANSFWVAFRQVTGLTPTEYRRQVCQ